MAGESIYDVDYSQSTGMPSDVLTENDYTQDVFYQTRPEVFDFGNRDRGEPYDGNPSFDNGDMDEEVKYQEKSLQRYNQSPKNWDKQRSLLTNPYDRSDRKGSVERIINGYFKTSARRQYKPTDKNKPPQLSGGTPTLAKLMHYTSSFSKKRAPRTTVSLTKAIPEKLIWEYLVKGQESWSSTAGHSVQIVLTKTPDMKDFREMKVRVNCSCEFWQFWGPDFNSGSGVRGLGPYRLGPSRIDPGVKKSPDIRDKKRENIICKHVAAVGKVFQKYAAKNNLDTYKEVESIFDEIEKQDKVSPEKTVEGVKAIVEEMDTTDQREIEPLIANYEKEEDIYRKERLKQGIFNKLEDNIETKEKSWLKKAKDLVVKFFRLFKRSKEGSVSRVIEMYLEK